MIEETMQFLAQCSLWLEARWIFNLVPNYHLTRRNLYISVIGVPLILVTCPLISGDLKKAFIRSQILVRTLKWSRNSFPVKFNKKIMIKIYKNLKLISSATRFSKDNLLCAENRCYLTGISAPPHKRPHVISRCLYSGWLRPGSALAYIYSGLLTYLTRYY